METLVQEPMSVAGFLAAVVALIFWLSGVPALRKLFEYAPPVIFVYFTPMLLTTARVIPSASPAYDWLIRYFLPFALFLLMVSVDLKSVARLGSTALIMVVTGTVGIVIGAPIALLIFKGALGPDAWKGFAALSGSWIGGTANMVAIAESVGTPDSEMGPVIVVDTVVGYGWMGILLALSAFQARFDRLMGARTEALEATNRRLAEMDTRRHPTQLRDMAVMAGLGMAAAVLSVNLGNGLPRLGDPTIISGTTWAVLLVVTVGLLLSFTPLRRLEEVGASGMGYTALYLLLAAIGAQADLRAVLAAPVYLLAGVVWLSIHIGLLFLVARLIRAPLFFVATGSMANVGGAASALFLGMAIAPFIIGRLRTIKAR
ncbi:MAG: DUF819 family protein, partial [Longimicrobiales bacterium]|nr:DUF819 family protein [Longimicrobiales bacterium]